MNNTNQTLTPPDKTVFVEPELEILLFSQDNLITASGLFGDDDLFGDGGLVGDDDEFGNDDPFDNGSGGLFGEGDPF